MMDNRKNPGELPEHFAPELVQLLVRALNEPVSLKFSDNRKAHRLRARLYKLRRALQLADHPLSDEFARLKIAVEPDNVVRIDNKDEDLVKEILKQIPDLAEGIEESDDVMSLLKKAHAEIIKGE